MEVGQEVGCHDDGGDDDANDGTRTLVQYAHKTKKERRAPWVNRII